MIEEMDIDPRGETQNPSTKKNSTQQIRLGEEKQLDEEDGEQTDSDEPRE
jgi:hypothetical protein